ncbi:unnamed protein product [Periconia digitata]|uniref:Uncharacterized protein n=1 Tax=Periconia digitata TaxID=1303443 RepID=A0A9W4XJ49_9PLEO|nr:unnamed protein product [Periconia digitata]
MPSHVLAPLNLASLRRRIRLPSLYYSRRDTSLLSYGGQVNNKKRISLKNTAKAIAHRLPTRLYFSSKNQAGPTLYASPTRSLPRPPETTPGTRPTAASLATYKRKPYW